MIVKSLNSKHFCLFISVKLINLVCSHLICDQFSPFISLSLENILTYTTQEVKSLELKNSGEIVEKLHFAHSFTVILVLITHHATSSAKDSTIG